MVSRKSIVQYCEGIAREFKPERIILFGSYAYGKPGPDSDVDILVIMRYRGNPVLKSVEIRSRVPAPFPMDLLVRSACDVRRRLAMDDFFMREITEQGVVVYEAGRA